MTFRKMLALLLACALVAPGLMTGVVRAEGTAETSGPVVYSVEDAYIQGDCMTFTVFADSTGDYAVDFAGDSGELELQVNGIAVGSVAIPTQGLTLRLNKGINTLVLPYNQIVSELSVHGVSPLADKGVTALYRTYEAETLQTNGTVLEDSRIYHEIASEASGRQAVRLDGDGQYVKFVLEEDTNALTLRACVPDNGEGTGENYTLTVTVGGKTYQAELTSVYTWVYGAFPFTNTPEAGTEHNFFDDGILRLDEVYPAGTEVVISKEVGDSAAFYILDLIETELVEEALPQPENSLSIADFGAVADDGKDDTPALLDAMDQAAEEGKEVWIPAGTFHFTESRIVIKHDDVTIRGAGMWHTVLTGDFAAFLIQANRTAFYDFKMEGTAVVRRDDVDPAAFEVASGSDTREGLTLQNIWVEHYKVGVWTYTISGVHMVGCRVRNTFADGINLCKASCNSMVEQCNFRGTGDDAVAMWSQTYPDVNNIVRRNTISAPDLANGIAIYGGREIRICDNIVSDIITEGSGINVSTNFSPAEFAERIIVEGNVLNRCGSLNDQSGSRIGAIWFNTVKDHANRAQVIIRNNEIRNSSYQGISFSGIGEVSNVRIEGNTIADSGTWAIEATSSVRCTVEIRGNTLIGNAQGGVNSNNGKNVAFHGEVSEANTAEPVEETEGNSGVSPVIWVIVGFAALIAVGIAVVTVIFKKTEKK